jgi:homoserine kinase
VRVPATSANLGPGFDSLGLALTLHDEVEVEVTRDGLSIEVIGEGAEVADRGEGHLVVKVIRQAFDVIDARAAGGVDPVRSAGPRSAGSRSAGSRSAGSRSAGSRSAGPRPAAAARSGSAGSTRSGSAGFTGSGDVAAVRPGLRLRCVNAIPHSRGLGSSAAAIVAGLIAARELHPYGRVLDDQAIFALATEIEGHPDNVAPCLAGGLTIAWHSPEGPRLARVDVDTEVVVFVPDQRVATERARGLLPGAVPHEDAATNAGRAALLIAALTARPSLAPEALLAATEDRIHQDYRAPAMPASAALLRRLRGKGIPAVLSGAGPAVLAFTTASQVDSIASILGNGWHKRPLNVDPDGARVQPRRP